MAEKNNEPDIGENISKIEALHEFYSESEQIKNEWKNSQKNSSHNELSSLEILQLHGNIEVEEGEEADLHKHYAECKKNPGHPQFIPINVFSLEHLPKDYQETDLYDLIKDIAELTVRISVEMTSPDRPEFYPNTETPYPFYNLRGKTNMRTGSGEISIHKFKEGHGYNGQGKRENAATGKNIEAEYTTCPCDKCVDTKKPNNIWYEIYVHTATHVVFDEIETSHASCRFFFDSDNSPLFTLDKFSLDHVDIQRDECHFKFVTCGDLGNRLYEKVVHMLQLWEKVCNKYRECNCDVTFIVSHPHGCSKQVSVGHLLGNYKIGEFNENIDRTKLFYTTGTCPGSSGARVYNIGYVGAHVHAGSLDGKRNYSCCSFVYKKVIK